MGMKLPAELERQLLEKGIVGPPTVVVQIPTIPKWITEKVQTPDPLVIQLYLTLPSMANSRMHWAAKARIVKKQRSAVSNALFGLPTPPLPVTVTFTRIAPRRLDDDNLAMSCKGVRDAVAEWFTGWNKAKRYASMM